MLLLRQLSGHGAESLYVLVEATGESKPTSFSSVPEDPGGRPLCRLPALARPRPHLSSALRRRSTPDAEVEETERMRFHKKHIFQIFEQILCVRCRFGCVCLKSVLSNVDSYLRFKIENQ